MVELAASRFLGAVRSTPRHFPYWLLGVGKTSLLRRGLVPELEAQGFLVAVCRNWSGAADHDDVVGFLEDRVKETCGGQFWTTGSGPLGFRKLARDGGDAVLILDQFEDLIAPTRRASQKSSSLLSLP